MSEQKENTQPSPGNEYQIALEKDFPAADASAAAMLPLDEPRIISIKFGTLLYRHFYRRIQQADWERFFDRFRVENYRKGAEVSETFEFETAQRELVTNTLERAEGYELDPKQTPRWRELLPAGHYRLFCLALREVRASRDAGDKPVRISEHHEVSLDALWSSDEAGNAIRYGGLIHRFNPPTFEQQKKFNRAVNTTRVIGDSRHGRTLFPEKQRLMMGYYDDLVVEVDGYSVGGVALAGVENIRREMDGCHKVSAVQALLNAGNNADSVPSATPEPAPGTEEDQ